MAYKFLRLSKYFNECSKDKLTLSFSQIEDILGLKLCKSAYKHIAYWYPDNTHTFPNVWIDEGFVMSRLNLASQNVQFEKSSVKHSKAHKTEIVSQSDPVITPQPMININILVDKILKFYSKIKTDGNARYLSWEHCHSAFRDARKDIMTEETLDLLCLHLGFYLASWGMYRGSSFILQKDYRVHKDAISELFRDQYSSLWSASCETLCKNESQDLLFRLVERIESIYVQKRRNIDGYDSVSNILITKILMGTMGCVPAYDRFFACGIRQFKIASGSFNSKSIRNLAEFYIRHESTLEDCRIQISRSGIEYPPMKILDMVFWQIGYELSLNNNENFNEEVPLA